MFIQMATLLWAFNFSKPLDAEGNPITPSSNKCIDAGVVVCVFHLVRILRLLLTGIIWNFSAFQRPSSAILRRVNPIFRQSYTGSWRLSASHPELDESVTTRRGCTRVLLVIEVVRSCCKGGMQFNYCQHDRCLELR